MPDQTLALVVGMYPENLLRKFPETAIFSAQWRKNMMGARILEVHHVAAAGKTGDIVKASISVKGDNACFKDLVDHPGNIAFLACEREARRTPDAAIEFKNPTNDIRIGLLAMPAVFTFHFKVVFRKLIGNLK